MSVDGKEILLGGLAYESVRAGYYLSLPEKLAKSLISTIHASMRDESLILTSLSVQDVWEEVLSNNFLIVPREVSQYGTWYPLDRVEWLHQMVFDYFLGCELIRRVVVPGTDIDPAIGPSMLRSIEVWDQPCQIALGLLDIPQGAKLLELIFRYNKELGSRVCKGQDDDQAELLAQATMNRIVAPDEPDFSLMRTVALALPYVPIVNCLQDCFRGGSEQERETIAEIVSHIVQAHYGTRGAERAEELLEAWIANKNERVQFYSAEGLWERDRGKAVATLRELLQKGEPETSSLVKQLMEKWNIE